MVADAAGIATMSHDEKTQQQTDAAAAAAFRSPSREEQEALVGLINRQQYAAAEALARQQIERFPEDGFVWKALAASLKPQGRLAEALAAQQQAVALSPDDIAAHYNLGNSLMVLGRPEQAQDSYARVISLQPSHHDAHLNLGNALQAQGRLTQAAESYRRALAARPESMQAHARLGHMLMALGRYDDVEAHFLRVLQAFPQDTLVNNQLGVLYRHQGRLDEAEARYRRALSIAPEAAEVHNNLGNVLLEQGHIEQAESSYRRALELHEALAEPHFNLGNIRRDQQRLLDAERSYRRALAIEPRYLMALNNLGLCLKKQGRLQEARQCFEDAIAIKPEFLQAHCNLAPLKTYAADDAHLDLLERQHHQLPSLPVAARISYWFALGKMREDAGRYGTAFDAYAEGNRLHHAQYPHDEAAQAAGIERVQSVFSANLFAGRQTPTHAGKIPIFIVGMPRSGTTLIEQILSSHPGVHGGGELTDLDDVLGALDRASGADAGVYPEIVATLSDDALSGLGQQYIERVWRQAPMAERITDKLPANFLHVGMIHMILPQAKIIHAVRDPMDACFSCYARLFEGNNLDFTYDLGTVGRYYARYIRLMQHWHRVLPAGTLIDLRYEAMVDDTEGQTRRLLDYLGLPWDERCLDFHQNRRVVRTASIAQVRRPIYRTSVARWKHFSDRLGRLWDIVGDCASAGEVSDASP